MRRYLSHFSRREATICPQGQIEPQQKVFTVPSISAGGGLYTIHPMRRGGVKSFVDDLVLGRGVVISRAATSLRSVETHPLTRRFVRNQTNNISVSWSRGGARGTPRARVLTAAVGSLLVRFRQLFFFRGARFQAASGARDSHLAMLLCSKRDWGGPGLGEAASRLAELGKAAENPR